MANQLDFSLTFFFLGFIVFEYESLHKLAICYLM